MNSKNVKVFIFIIVLGILVGGGIVYSQRSSERKNPMTVQKKPSFQEPTKISPSPSSEEIQTRIQSTPTTDTPENPNPIVATPIDTLQTIDPPNDKNAPRWVVVHKDGFDTLDSVKKYYKYREGVIEWNEKYKAMLLNSNTNNNEIYAAVHQSLPGDLRVRFKTLRRKSAEEVNIGMVISIKGSLAKEDGYFVEWELGTAVIKKCNREKIRVDAKTPATPDRWVNLEVVKVGGHFTMAMEGKIVLDWTDQKPITAPDHDLFSFYIYADSTLINDLIIERNENDPIQPLPSDPATDSNIIKGIRPPVTKD
jgi:hypothetical protein